MLETIEETEENANLIARADFKKKFGEDLNDVPDWIRIIGLALHGKCLIIITVLSSYSTVMYD
jgi:hypothetical protein